MKQKVKIEEEGNKENRLEQKVYSKIKENEAELTSYLKYIRHKSQPKRVPITVHKLPTILPKELRQKKGSGLVKPSIDEYLKIIKEVAGLQNYSGRKIIRKLIQYLQQFPSMTFLIQVVSSFGKSKKKLCLSESSIMAHATDEMIPLFQKVIDKVGCLKKEAQSKKLMELGQRIAHLHKMVQGARKQVVSKDTPLRVLEQQRVDKYLIMEDNLIKAEKNFGTFSQTFHKNQQIFSNINKVYEQISRFTESNKHS